MIAATHVAAGQKAMRFSTAADPSAVVASAAAAEKKQRKDRDTAVAEAAAQQPAPDCNTPAARAAALTPVPEALAALPPTLGRFMADQGFAAPTSIQAK